MRSAKYSIGGRRVEGVLGNTINRGTSHGRGDKPTTVNEEKRKGIESTQRTCLLSSRISNEGATSMVCGEGKRKDKRVL